MTEKKKKREREREKGVEIRRATFFFLYVQFKLLT